MSGQFIEHFIHGPRAGDVIEGFHHVAATRIPLWMRQVVQFSDRAPRFVEGIAVYLQPGRIYGGLAFGETSANGAQFERAELKRASSGG